VDSFLGIIAEPRRQHILQLVWDRELSAGEIAAEFEVTFGAVSQHLRVLHDAGLVGVRRQGRQRLYLARKAALGPLAAVLEAHWNQRLAQLKTMVEQEERRPPATRPKKRQFMENRRWSSKLSLMSSFPW